MKQKKVTDRNLNPEELQEIKDKFEPLWGMKEYSEFMGIKSATVFSQISRGVDMPPFVKIGSITRWRPETVRKWIEAKEKERRRRNFERSEED